MATVMLLASVFLALWSFKRKRALAQRRRSETTAAKFFGHVFEFSASLASVLLFYHVLLGLLAFGWKGITVANLRRLEDSFAGIQRFVDQHKLTWGATMMVLIVFYLAAHMWIQLLDRETPFRVIKKIKGFLHVVCTITFLLASFTLLGSVPGQAAATLEIRLRQARTEYGVLRRDIGSALAGVTVNQAYDNATKALPAGETIPELINSSINEGADLRSEYAEAQSMYGIHDSRIENLIKRTQSQAASLERPGRAAAQDGHGSVNPEHEELPETITYKQILQARTSIETFNKRFRPRFLRILKHPGGKEIILEMPDGPIDHIIEMLDSLTGSFPLFKPILDVLGSTLKDVVGLALERKIDELTIAVVNHPEEIETRLPMEARELVDSASPKIGPEERRQFRRQVDSMQHQVSELRETSARLQGAIRIAQTKSTADERPLTKTLQTEQILSRPKSAIQRGDPARIERLREGVAKGWVVTRNSGTDPHKLFVHRSSGVWLEDLKFLIEESPDGGTWTVYLPRETVGGTKYGGFVGVISKPDDVDISECSCN